MIQPWTKAPCTNCGHEVQFSRSFPRETHELELVRCEYCKGFEHGLSLGERHGREPSSREQWSACDGTDNNACIQYMHQRVVHVSTSSLAFLSGQMSRWSRAVAGLNKDLADEMMCAHEWLYVAARVPHSFSEETNDGNECTAQDAEGGE